MGGLIMAFQDFRPSLGFFGSQFVGMKHFDKFFASPLFKTIVRNTFMLSVYSLVLGFPFPILLALCLNELRDGFFKRAVQLVTYAPYFISMVVMVSLLFQWFDMRIGIVNLIAVRFGFTATNIVGVEKYFRSTYVGSAIWQFTGFNSIIYLAALTSINPELYEAAIVDGAGRFRQAISITLPGIVPTIIILLILRVGQIMNVSFEKVLLLYNNAIMDVADVISTYVYRMGLERAQYSFSASVGLFNSVINAGMLLLVNQIAKKLGETSLW